MLLQLVLAKAKFVGEARMLAAKVAPEVIPPVVTPMLHQLVVVGKELVLDAALAANNALVVLLLHVQVQSGVIVVVVVTKEAFRMACHARASVTRFHVLFQLALGEQRVLLEEHATRLETHLTKVELMLDTQVCLELTSVAETLLTH